jgi:dihydroorotase
LRIWIRDGRVVHPDQGTIEEQDIVVDSGKILKLQPYGMSQDDDRISRVIDASGKIVIPGLIDMHVHLREPGHEHKETIATGSLAGVVGGFVGLACMPNTVPVNDNRTVTEFVLEQTKKAGLLKVYPIAAITKGQQGHMLTDFGDLRQAGAVGISDDGFCVANQNLMKQAMEQARYHGLTIISHCEDRNLSAGGVMHEGSVSVQIGLKGIPSASEEIMVQREISLAKQTGCPVHIAHVSTAGSVQAIKKAKAENIPVTAETAPHYFTLDHRAVIGYDTNTKMNPPLRTPEDVEAIKMGLKESAIDVIATDHAPHSSLEKDVKFDQAAFGIIGLETAIPLTMSLVRDGVLTLPEAIKKISLNPATILGANGGIIKEGESADLAIINPDVEYILVAGDIHSKSKNTPFIGRTLRGRNTLTMVEGRVVWEYDAKYIGC